MLFRSIESAPVFLLLYWIMKQKFVSFPLVSRTYVIDAGLGLQRSEDGEDEEPQVMIRLRESFVRELSEEQQTRTPFNRRID